MVAALAQVVGFLVALTLVIMLLDRMEPEAPASPMTPRRRRHRRVPVPPARTGLHEGGAVAMRTCCRSRSPRPTSPSLPPRPLTVICSTPAPAAPVVPDPAPSVVVPRQRSAPSSGSAPTPLPDRTPLEAGG